MIAREREDLILDLLGERAVVSIHAIMASCPGVSAVTLRRDLSRLERLGKLSRTRGGAVGLPRSDRTEASPENLPQEFDALILPPVKGQWAHTLRQHVARRRAILIAESAPQVGGIYLGPRNFEGARSLGRFAGKQHPGPRAEILLVALEGLPNTRERVEGFSAGFAEAFAGDLVFRRVDGRGLLKEVIRQTSDAFAAHPGIDVVFGVNDHTILGALDVAERLGRDVAGYSVGGEGGSLFDTLAAGGALRAVLALFPEVVGRVAIDTVCRVLAGDAVGAEVITPSEVVTREACRTTMRRSTSIGGCARRCRSACARSMRMMGRRSPAGRSASCCTIPRTNGTAAWRRRWAGGRPRSGRGSSRATPRTRSRRSCASSSG